MYPFNLSEEEVETGGSWGSLAEQSSLIEEFCVLVRQSLSKEGVTLSSGLHMHVYTWTPVQVHSHMCPYALKEIPLKYVM